MKAYNLGIAAVIVRFYFMMLIVIAAGFLGQWWISIFALPILMSIMLGVTFGKKEEGTTHQMTASEKSYKQTA